MKSQIFVLAGMLMIAATSTISANPFMQNTMSCDAELAAHKVSDFKITFETISTSSTRSGIYKSPVIAGLEFSLDGKKNHYSQIPGTVFYGYDRGKLVNWVIGIGREANVQVGASSTNFDSADPTIMGAAGLINTQAMGPAKILLKRCKPDRSF